MKAAGTIAELRVLEHGEYSTLRRALSEFTQDRRDQSHLPTLHARLNMYDVTYYENPGAGQDENIAGGTTERSDDRDHEQTEECDARQERQATTGSRCMRVYEGGTIRTGPTGF